MKNKDKILKSVMGKILEANEKKQDRDPIPCAFILHQPKYPRVSK